jgi:hypothetical protein
MDVNESFQTTASRREIRVPSDSQYNKRNIAKIPVSDIEWFFKTLESGVLKELANGDFLTPRKGASERLYWHENKGGPQVTVGVAVEVVVSLGAIGRLIEEFGWPAECIVCAVCVPLI